MPRFLSVLTGAAALAAFACAVFAFSRLSALERRLAAVEEAPPPATNSPVKDPEVARLRAEIEALKARPEPKPYYAVDPTPVENAIREALSRSTEPKAEETLEEMAARAAVDGTVPQLASELGLNEDQARDLKALYREAALAEVRLWRNATTEAAVQDAEAEAARIRASRDTAVREKLTLEQREKFDGWLLKQEAPVLRK